MKRDFARRLRANPSDAEHKLWTMLRYKQLGGARFRRQQPIGPYVADFFCPKAKLIIELDGGQHNTASGIFHDEQRSKWLAARGYRVMRFWNDEVLKNPQAVLSIVSEAVKTPPTRGANAPRPPPQGGRLE